jgi:hypothetical protein
MAGSSVRQRPVEAGQPRTLYSFIWRQRERGVIPHATNRDLRRTFKTLAGKAGSRRKSATVSRTTPCRTSAPKHYDRWNYMVEKRAGMAKWDKFVRAMLAKKRLKAAA